MLTDLKKDCITAIVKEVLKTNEIDEKMWLLLEKVHQDGFREGLICGEQIIIGKHSI